MALRDIVLYPDHPLTKRAEAITEFGPNLALFAEDMVESMEAYDGVGLAAPQVGVSRRFVVLREPEGELMLLVNPEILASEGEAEGEEGCLSLPFLYAEVSRATRIRVRAQDLEGRVYEFEAHDFLARIIQHECDHLDGIVFVDRLNLLSRGEKMQEWQEIRARLAAEGSKAHAD